MMGKKSPNRYRTLLSCFQLSHGKKYRGVQSISYRGCLKSRYEEFARHCFITPLLLLEEGKDAVAFLSCQLYFLSQSPYGNVTAYGTAKRLVFLSLQCFVLFCNVCNNRCKVPWSSPVISSMQKDLRNVCGIFLCESSSFPQLCILRMRYL